MAKTKALTKPKKHKLTKKQMQQLTPRAGKDFTLNLPKEHLSVSQIESYLQCPQKYFRERVLGHKTPPSIAMCEGTWMSQTMEWLNNEIIAEQAPSLTASCRKHAAFCKKGSKEVADWDGYNLKDIQLRGARHLAMYFKEQPVAKAEQAEAKKTIEIAGIPVVCIADLLEPNTVLDYKVAGAVKGYGGKIYYDPNDSLQLSMYSEAFDKVQVGYMVFTKKVEGCHWLPGTRKDRDLNLAYLEFIVSNVAKGISQEVWFPNYDHFFCSPKWCAHWDTCMGKF